MAVGTDIAGVRNRMGALFLALAFLALRSSGAPLLPEFIFVVTPGNDGNAVTVSTGGANTLRFTLTTPAGSGNAVINTSFCED